MLSKDLKEAQNLPKTFIEILRSQYCSQLFFLLLFKNICLLIQYSFSLHSISSLQNSIPKLTPIVHTTTPLHQSTPLSMLTLYSNTPPQYSIPKLHPNTLFHRICNALFLFAFSYKIFLISFYFASIYFIINDLVCFLYRGKKTLNSMQRQLRTQQK